MYRIISTIVITAYSFTLTAQNKPEQNNYKTSADLNSLFQYSHDNELFNGSVLIFNKDSVLLQKSYGKLNVGSDKLISSDTPFLLASVSKQFTAFGIVMLRSKGLLNYDDNVKEYLTDFPYPKITIRHLLNHTSGLPEYMKFINPQAEKLKKQYQESGTIVTNKKVASMIAKKKPSLRFLSGTNFDYSNTGYMYLAMIIESLSGKSFSQYLKETIFTPLNMTNSWAIDSSKPSRKERAIGYKKNYITNNSHENESPEFFKTYGDGGIYSSARDLHKWFVALDNEMLIGTNELEEAYTRPIIGEKKGPYGFGWFIKELPFNKHKVLAHSGQFAGFTNSVIRDLDTQTTSIILSNNSHRLNREINRAVLRIIYNMPHKKPKLSAEIAIGNIVSAKGIQSVKIFYELNKDNDLYNFSEESINSLGYGLLELDNLNKAIDIFKWNVELNTESANAYDSLGEAYLAIGNKKDALINYQKSYNLDNSNTNAEKMIQKLKTE